MRRHASRQRFITDATLKWIEVAALVPGIGIGSCRVVADGLVPYPVEVDGQIGNPGARGERRIAISAGDEQEAAD